MQRLSEAVKTMAGHQQMIKAGTCEHRCLHSPSPVLVRLPHPWTRLCTAQALTAPVLSGSDLSHLLSGKDQVPGTSPTTTVNIDC